MQPIPQSNTRQNKRARKLLHSSTPRHLKRSRVSSQSSSSHTVQENNYALGDKQAVNFEEDTQRCHLASFPKITADTPPNWLTRPTTLSSNNRWEVAADIQTFKQYSCIGSMNAQEHLATTAISQKTPIVFLKIPTLLEAEAVIALICFSKVNLES